MFVSGPNISLSRGRSQGCLGFPSSCGGCVADRCVSAETLEASVHRRCCCWEAGCWQGQVGLKTLLLLSHCAQHRARSVPIAVMSRSHRAALSHGSAHTDRLTQTHTSLKIPGSSPPLQQPSVHYCHSFLAKQTSAHRLTSLGFITFIIWIVLTVVLRV